MTEGKRDYLKVSNQESNRLTRECLQTALISLMSQKPFDKISISEIVRRAGVSRTAFYRNYNAKEEILNEMADHFLEGLAASFEDPAYENNARLWYYNFFLMVQKNEGILRLLLQAHMLNSPVFSAYSFNDKLKLFKESAGKYEFIAWMGAFSTIVVRWFQDGMQEDVESMATLCARILDFSRKDPDRPD